MKKPEKAKKKPKKITTHGEKHRARTIAEIAERTLQERDAPK